MAIDLKAYQARLNSDSSVRASFFEDPVKALEHEGLVLPDDAKRQLAKAVARTKQEAPPGSSLGPGPIDIQVNIRAKPDK